MKRPMVVCWPAAGLNRIIWYSIYKGASPYPGRPGEQPGQAVDLD